MNACRPRVRFDLVRDGQRGSTIVTALENVSCLGGQNALYINCSVLCSEYTKKETAAVPVQWATVKFCYVFNKDARIC